MTMNIRNLSSRDISLKDTGGNVYIVPAYSQLTSVDDALWNDNEFRRWLRFRIRDIVVESLIGGGGSYGPLDAPYVTTASNVSLTNESVLGTDVTMRGAVGSRPVAGIAGKTYYVTDANSERVSRDNGTTWDDQKISWSFVTNNASIDSNARVAITKSDVAVGTRRKLNFIPGAGVGITTADNGGSEKVDVTIGIGTSPIFLGPTSWGSTQIGLANNEANLYLIPNLSVPTTLTKIGAFTAAGTGNADLGIYYSDDNSTFTRVASTGSINVNVTAGATISSTTLTPLAGRYWYFAIVKDTTGANFYGSGFASDFPYHYSKASSFPLPSTLTSTTHVLGGSNTIISIYGLA